MGQLTLTTAQVQAILNGTYTYTDASHVNKEILRINNSDSANKGPFCLTVGDHNFDGTEDYWMIFGYNNGLEGAPVLAGEPVFATSIESAYETGGVVYLEYHLQWTGGSTYTSWRPMAIQINKTDGRLSILSFSTSGQADALTLAHNGNVGIAKFIVQAQLTGALTDGAPTDTEIDTITGLTPATAGAGWQCTIKDNTGSAVIYRVESDGTNWFYTVMTKAV